MSIGGDSFAHALKHLVQQQSQGHRSSVYGRIASYDPALHRVRVLIPSFRNEDNLPAISPWLPLGSAWVGMGFGIQIAPLGGATADNPTAGEACVVQLLERTYGVTAAAHLIYDEVSSPPLVGIAPGEAVLRHQTGTQIYFRQDGNIEITVTGSLIANVTGDVKVTTQGTATVTAAVAANVLAPAITLAKNLTDVVYTLCTSVFATWVENHVHADPQGGDTGPPTTSPPTTGLTSITKAE